MNISTTVLKGLSRATASILSLSFFLHTGSAQAAPFDPVVELFRFGAGDRLLIDRGGPVDSLGDVNGDGLDDAIVGSGVGTVRVVFGPTNGNNGVLNGVQLTGFSGFTIRHDSVNISYVSAAGDINNDGLNDVLVGSLGGAHVIFGSRERFPTVFDVSALNGRNGFSIESSVTAVSNAGDVNGDGIDDILLGNANATVNNLPGVGAAYVVYGRSTGFNARLTIDDIAGSAGYAVIGGQQQDRIGHSVGAAGDFNHDGIDDIMIGAPNKTQDSKPEVGEAYIVYGQPQGHPSTISVLDLTANTGLVIKGLDNQDYTGASVSGIGDLNHDGFDDVAIGSPGKGPFGTPSDYPGEVYILFGGQFSGIDQIDRRDLNGGNGVRVRGIRGGIVPIQNNEAIWGDLAGTSLDGVGDMNGDGMDDFMIGASHTIINARRKGVGQTYIIFGSQSAFPARLSLNDLDGANGFRINGIGTVDYFGVYTRGADDFNDDGINDIIVGASGEGASYIIYGRDYGLGRVPAPVARSFNAQPSRLPEAARIMGANLAPLAFNELADPTGPNPLPEGTPTDLNDPNAAGYIAPNIFAPVAVLRPNQAPMLQQTDQQQPAQQPAPSPVIASVQVPVFDGPEDSVTTPIAIETQPQATALPVSAPQPAAVPVAADVPVTGPITVSDSRIRVGGALGFELVILLIMLTLVSARNNTIVNQNLRLFNIRKI